VIFHWQSSTKVLCTRKQSETAKTKTWLEISRNNLVEAQITPLRLPKQKGHSRRYRSFNFDFWNNLLFVLFVIALGAHVALPFILGWKILFGTNTQFLTQLCDSEKTKPLIFEVFALSQSYTERIGRKRDRKRKEKKTKKKRKI